MLHLYFSSEAQAVVNYKSIIFLEDPIFEVRNEILSGMALNQAYKAN